MDIEQALIRYEKARQEVQKYSKQRSELIDQCKNQDGGYPAPDSHAPNCLYLAYSDQQRICKENDSYFSFEEILFDNDDDRYCGNCQKSYEIKINELAKARHEFGNAKRSLSAIGKRLIKQQQPNN